LSVGADNFVLPQFSQVGEWRENQILIPDWTYFYCPGTALKIGEWPENQKSKLI